MGILKNIKNFFKKNNILQLNEKNPEYFKTMPIITIDAIETIIENETVYERFMSIKNPNDVFYGNVTKSECVKAVYEYTDIMIKNGEKFSKETLKRIKKITGHKFKNMKSKNEEQKNENSKDEKMRKLALDIIRDENVFKLYMNLDDEDGKFCGFSKIEVEQYIASKMFELFKDSMLNFNRESEMRLSVLKELYDIKVKNYTIDIEKYEPINRYFEKSIMYGIPYDADKQTIIEQIYCRLNKKVAYDQYFFSENQSLSNELTLKIYNKTPKQCSEDKIVTCKSWAELYAYLLKKNGITAYINRLDDHKFVKIIDGENIIIADATIRSKSQKDKTEMTDLTRAKLGLKPAGLQIRNLRTNERKAIDVKSQKDFSVDTTLENVADLIELIDDDKNYSSKYFEIESDNQKILQEISVINKLIKESKLEGIELISYLSNLRYIIMGENERKKTKLYHDMYTQDSKNTRTIVPILSINLGNSNESNYKYLTYNTQKGLVPISTTELKQKIDSGEYKKIQHKDDEKEVKDTNNKVKDR